MILSLAVTALILDKVWMDAGSGSWHQHKYCKQQSGGVSK